MDNTIMILISSGSIGMGIIILYFLGKLYLSSRDMDQWQVARGVITVSNVVRDGEYYGPAIQYRYCVSGTEYEGRGISITPKLTYNRKAAQDWIEPYPVGKSVEVFYKPENPRMSVLEKGFSIKTGLVILSAALIFIAFGPFIIMVK